MHSSLFAVETTTGYGGGIFGNNKPSPFNIEEIPHIKIKLATDDAVACELDKSSKTYICPNQGKPILVKHSSFGFMALSRDEKNDIYSPIISHVEAEEKVLYETASFPGYPGMGMGMGSYGGMKPNNTKDLNNDYTTKVMAVDAFFGTFNFPGMKSTPRAEGSAEYEQIAKAFLDDKALLQEKMNQVYREKSYSVELEDGQKIKCDRGDSKPPTEELKKYEAQTGVKIQCGSFSCDTVKVDGKEYQATMLYESSPGSLASGSIHLIDKDGIGPKKSIKKISSPSLLTPLVDNTYYLENADTTYYKNYMSKMIPVSLKQDRDKIAQYKDPGLDQLIEYYKLICNDSKGLDNLLDGKKKLLTKLAETELAELIRILDNGALVGEFIDPTLAPGLGCLYQGVYLNEEAAKNLERLKKNIHPDRHVEQTISLEKATELFNKAAAMKDIAWKYTPDGCYARAHLMARRFEAEGVRVDKVWIKGDLYVPGTEPLIRWNFHVAPIVYIEDEKGKIQKMVIDPSLFSKPVTVEEWDKKMSKNTIKGSVVTAFPFPQNSAFMERSTLSFSSSDPYLPGDHVDMTEEEKMSMSNGTMKMYKPLETR